MYAHLCSVFNWEPKNSSCNSRYHSIHSSENKKKSSFFKKNSKKIEWYLKFFRVLIELYLKWMLFQVDTRKKLEFDLKKSSFNRVYIQRKSSRLRVISRLYIQRSLDYIYLLYEYDSKLSQMRLCFHLVFFLSENNNFSSLCS